MPFIFKTYPAPPTPALLPNILQGSASFVGAGNLTASAKQRMSVKATLLATTSTLAADAFVQAASFAIKTVGPGKQYATFAAANLAANDGDLIQIFPGTYNNDYASIIRNITITGMGSSPDLVKLSSTGNIPGDKAIWVINSNVTINNIEMFGAAGVSGNDEAIRLESGNLTLNSVWIHDCQTGLLANSGPGNTVNPSNIVINGCEFNNNGTGTGQTHNLYVGIINSLVIQGNSFFHDCNVGHEIKSRALSNTIQDSRIFDNSSNASYSIDLPDGGICIVRNNIIQQSDVTSNPTMIEIGAEVPTFPLNPSTSLLVTNNVIINEYLTNPLGVRNFVASITAQITNNQIFGLTAPQIASGPNSQSGNTFLGSEPVLDQTHPWNAVYVQQRPIKNYGAVATPATFYKEFAAHFADNDTFGIGVGKVAQWRKGDGLTIVPSQADRFIYWQPSGRLRTASFTAQPNQLAAAELDTLKAYAVAGSWNNTPWATTATITAKNITFEVLLYTKVVQSIGTGDGTAVTFSGTLAGAPIRPNSVFVQRGVTTANCINDNGAGAFQVRPDLTGTINYTTGAISVTFANAYKPTAGQAVNVTYAVTSDAGILYTLSASNEITRNTNIRQTRSGQLSCKWRMFGEFRNGTGINATPESDIWGMLYITMFNDGTYSVWGTLYNGRFTKNTATSKIVGFYRIAAGGVPLFTYGTLFKLFAGCPVYTCNTDGLHPYSGVSVDKTVVGFPLLTLGDGTTTGLYDSYNTWWNVSTPAMRAALQTVTPAVYTPYNVADTGGNINGTGLHIFVGPQTGWAATAMLAQNWDALRQDRVNAFVVGWCAICYPDATPGIGYPGNMMAVKGTGVGVNYPGLGAPSISTAWYPGAGGTITVTGGYTPNGDSSGDGSHAGAWADYQALSTGQEQWVDMVIDQAIGQLGWNPGGVNSPTATRNPLINSVHYYACYPPTLQVRAGAWNQRNVGNAYWLASDDHPMKPLLSDIELATYDLYDNFVRPPNMPVSAQTLGVFFTTGQPYAAGWQSDYLMTTFCNAIRRGRIPISHNFVNYHLVKWAIGKHLAPSCPWGSHAYHYGNIAGPAPVLVGGFPGFVGTTFAQQWSDVWFGGGNGTIADPFEQPITTGPSAGACPISGLYAISNSNIAGGGQSYPCQSLSALAMAKTIGLTGAAAAWAYVENEMLNANIPDTTWAKVSQANWRIDTPR